MKILVVGAGVSGIVFSIAYKRAHPEDEIVIIEKMDRPLKKLYATGNGKCNLGNAKIDAKDYFNSEFVNAVLGNDIYSDEITFLDSMGIKVKTIGQLAYPISESAETVVNALIKEAKRNAVKILCSTTLIDYDSKKDIRVTTSDGEIICDKLVFACGGRSSQKLGSDGSIYPILEKHDYQIKDLKPALCPIFTKEKTDVLDGTRIKAGVKVYIKNNHKIFDESGEVLFKDHGLSGIVVFNASRAIAHTPNKSITISLDLLPEISADELNEYRIKNGEHALLDAYIHPKMIAYIKSLKNISIIDAIKKLTFNYDKSYGYDFSQISIGGVNIDEVNDSLQSKREKNVYFLGEILDVDAPCGGFNLTWAIMSAKKCAEKISR